MMSKSRTFNVCSYIVMLGLLMILPGCFGSFRHKKKKKKNTKRNEHVMIQKLEYTEGHPVQYVQADIRDEKQKQGDRLRDQDLFADNDFDDDFDIQELEDIHEQYVHLTDETLSERQGFKPIYFEFDEHALKEDQKEVLRYNAEHLKELIAKAEEEKKPYTVLIEGHSCHSMDEADYNFEKSKQRAEACYELLREQGIDTDHIKLVGRGYDIPVIKEGMIVTGGQEEQWPNRRAEISIIYG
ncbi:MAG: OmpA family protein [Candidatus Babeliales bacterium]